MTKYKYPMKSGPFLGLVIDYEKLIRLQASSNSETNEIKYTMGKPKTKVKKVSPNRRGGRHD